jgi:hypothetical protein
LSVTPVQNVANIDFQATTRGGRRMDAILKGKAAFRTTTVGVSETIGQIGNQCGVFGLPVVLISTVVSGMAGSISSMADSRCWKCLPSEYAFYALKLPAGRHTIECRRYVYFELAHQSKKEVSIKDDKDMVVFFAPPPLIGLYSEHLLK